MPWHRVTHTVMQVASKTFNPTLSLPFSSSLSSPSYSEYVWSYYFSSSPPNLQKLSYETSTLSPSPLLKVGGYSGFSMFSSESANSSRAAITNSSTVETTIPVVFFRKYGRVSIPGISPIALANF